MTAAASLFVGPVQSEARAAYHRAREAGMSALRALVVANVASHRDCWMFRSKLAQRIGCSVRTVQRGLTQACELGLMGKARSKPNEKPPGLDTVVPCGWSHRWIIGWGKAGAEVKRAVQAARAKWIVRQQLKPTSKVDGCTIDRKCPPTAPRPLGRTWTAAELDRELELAARNAPPPEKPPPERG